MKLNLAFIPGHIQTLREMWTPVCDEKCREYGFNPTLAPVSESDAWRAVLNSADLAITSWGSPVFSDELLKSAPHLKMLGHAAGSARAVTNQSTYAAKLTVSTANPVMARGVAEWSLLATLLASRKFGAYANFCGQKRMNWARQFDMGDIRRQTIGIWGVGDTTRHLVRLLAPLEPGRLLIASRHTSETEIASWGGSKVELEELLSSSDIVHLLVGVNAENYGRIGSSELARMRDGATLINCGRAHLTQEAALETELCSGRINAILDVYFSEPTPADCPLEALENVILTPHNAGFPGRNRFVPFLLDEFNRFLHGEKLQGEINAERFATMTREYCI